MGGLLRKRGELRRDWEQVLSDSKWSITKMPRELNNAIYLSYEDMSPYLKQCFLYYSLLPKSITFNMYQVVAMWMSEGFIHGNSSDLEELGKSYYKELVSRNLIEPDKSYFDLWVCSMHDVVRSFAQYMTKDEAFVAHDGENDALMKLGSQKFLRLSIETNQLQSGELDWKSLHEQQLVRTLISTIQIKMKPGDSLATFSSMRTLHIESVDVAVLVESLHQLKHLRYLTLVNADISALPVNICKMKLLQYLDLDGCTKIENLPRSIVKLGQLRSLRLANISMIPRGFGGLTNMRRLVGFRAHTDGDWCSLDELGPLSQLRHLVLIQLENVSAASFGSKAKLCEKVCLTDLYLLCTSRLGEDGLVKEKQGVSEEEQQRIEKVFDELCPPPSTENIYINGFFGQQLPSWIMSTSTVPLNNLKVLFFSDLACCTQLPTGLCQLPYLQLLQVFRAPCIRRVGIAFLQAATTPFPRLNKMKLIGMVKWEEWEWEEQVQAMPRLEKLWLINCKLGCVPPGLSSHAKALKIVHLSDVQQLSYLENFPFVVELILVRIPNLEGISNLPNLQKLNITNCPNLKVLESIPALERLVLEDYTMDTLPRYMPDIKPQHLQLFCRLSLLALLAVGQSGTEWDKFSHVDHVKAYARDGDNPRKWYVLYKRRDNCKMDSNISSSTVFEGKTKQTSFVSLLHLHSHSFPICKLVSFNLRPFIYICCMMIEYIPYILF
jgi:Leucine-rich repeat (LRR) protein